MGNKGWGKMKYPCPVCTTGYIEIYQDGLKRKLKCVACGGEAKMTEAEIREWLGQGADRYLNKHREVIE